MQNKLIRVGIKTDGVKNSDIDDHYSLVYRRLINDLGNISDTLYEDKFPSLKHAITRAFPITNGKKGITITLDQIEIKQPIYNPEQCKTFSFTYAYNLWARVSLEHQDKKGKVTKKESRKLFLARIPKLHGNQFIINGVKKIIANKLSVSPGVRFLLNNKNNCNKMPAKAVIIPKEGSWCYLALQQVGEHHIFTLSSSNTGKKFYPATAVLLGMNMSTDKILKRLCNPIEATLYCDQKGVFSCLINKSSLALNKTLSFNIVDDKLNVVAAANTPLKQCHLENAKLFVAPENINQLLILNHIQHKKEIIAPTFSSIDSHKEALKQHLNQHGQEKVILAGANKSVVHTLSSHSHISNTKDAWSKLDSESFSYRSRQESPLIVKSESDFLELINLDLACFNLGKIGRAKLNDSMGDKDAVDKNNAQLTSLDIVHCIEELTKIINGQKESTDIDNLQMRCLESVDRSVLNIFSKEIYRVTKTTHMQLTSKDSDNKRISELIDFSHLDSALRDFFNREELSQLSEDDNPLSTLVHSRKIYGQAGIDLDATTIEMRDVNSSYYGRICPVETPEGQNIGLVESLAFHARSDERGFLTTPFYRVVDRKVDTSEKHYLATEEECQYNIAQFTSVKNGYLPQERVVCRHNHDLSYIPGSEIDYVDISSRQICSISSSLVPFLEHNVADRVLMSCNMQRQAVPLLASRSPIIGSFMEGPVAKCSQAVIVAKNAGVVTAVSSKRIMVKREDTTDVLFDIYTLQNLEITNKNTCFHQSPSVQVNDKVVKGDVLAEEISTDNGELSLGVTVRVGYCSLYGYNFEDSIIISEDLHRKHSFSSIHIEEISCYVSNTSLGPEETTCDVPGVTPSSMSDLDDTGLIKVGTKIKPNSILVGKITPKQENIMTPEERLLKTIFSSVSTQYDNSSLKAPAHVYGGYVTKVSVIDRNEIDNNTEWQDYTKEITEGIYNFINQDLAPKNPVENVEDLISLLKRTRKVEKRGIITAAIKQVNSFLQYKFEKPRSKDRNPNLLSGFEKIIRIQVAKKQNLQLGDKLTNRHGAKGVVSTILKREDMPYTSDGKPLDVVLSPTGVPSRMNIGQVFEATLGLFSHALGMLIKKALLQDSVSKLRRVLEVIYNQVLENNIDFALSSDAEILQIARDNINGVKLGTEIFNSTFTKDKIHKLLEGQGLPSSGKMQLYDGRTGKPMCQKSTVGYLYMLKLDHLVDSKMHARSTGPYSLITQQPLGGKSHFGGQRIGEMEAWSLQAYGASNILHEMITVKSDDHQGRVDLYKGIVFGHNIVQANLPESSKLLYKELQALGMDIQLTFEDNKDTFKKDIKSTNKADISEY